MPKEFRFPDVGEGITEGELIRWLVKEGDTVQEDQPLVEVETDKAIVTLPSPYSGTILHCHGQEGEIIQVGSVLVTFSAAKEPQEVTASPGRDPGAVVGRLEEAPEEAETMIRAIPSVRALAKELHVDLNQIRGSGPGGRILREDVEQAAGSKTQTLSKGVDEPDVEVERIPLRGIRRASARHVAQAAQRAAHVTFMDDADVTELEQVRTKEKPRAEQQGYKLTYIPFLIKAVIAGLKAHPYLNATLDEERGEILLKKSYHIGIAVDTLEGLMVFVLKHADEKSILDLAQEIGQLIQKAQTRSIDLSQLKGSTFTITNYGVIGGSYGTPILNYPEVGILGMGRVQDKPVARSGQIVIRRMMPLSLSFDHRVIDGAEAARFLNVVIQHLEDPHLMLLKGR